MRRLLGIAACSWIFIASTCGAPQNSGGTSSPVPNASGDLTAIVASMVFPVAGILNYTPPSEAEKATFRSALEALLKGDESAALEKFNSLDLPLKLFSDVSGRIFYLVREDSSTPRGWGLYAYDPSATRRIGIEAPHPIADLHTEDQAASLFLNLSARALLIAGTHRCADPGFSPCSGTTAVCNTGGTDEPYRLSDASHSKAQVFQTAHEVFAGADNSFTAVALHGFAQAAGEPHAFISDGTETLAAADAPSNRLASLLVTATGVSDAARSCNSGADARLCGTTDLQARFLNGSADACTTAAKSSAQRFLHIEQSLDLRTDGGAVTPGQLEQALRELF